MKKVKIESITTSSTYRDAEEVKIYVDNELIGCGSYGGEPEDNMRGRDYSWVEPLIKKLAEKLGAEVIIENKEE